MTSKNARSKATPRKDRTAGARRPVKARLITTVTPAEFAPIEAAFRELAEAAAANFPGRPKMVAYQLQKALWRAADVCLPRHPERPYPIPDARHDRLRDAMTAAMDVCERAFGVVTDARGRQFDTDRRDALFLKFSEDLISRIGAG